MASLFLCAHSGCLSVMFTRASIGFMDDVTKFALFRCLQTFQTLILLMPLSMFLYVVCPAFLQQLSRSLVVLYPSF
jgi:hypothetical protein